MRINFLILLILIGCSQVLAQTHSPWVRTDDSVTKESANHDHVSGEPNITENGIIGSSYVNTSCRLDLSIDFNISIFSNLVNFHVDHLYIAATNADSNEFLDKLLAHHREKNELQILALKPLQWNSWDGTKDDFEPKTVSFCIGASLVTDEDNITEKLLALRMVYKSPQYSWCPYLSNANCFVDNGTEHIIHAEYRCSDNQCWQPGGDKNCWDAHTWFTITDGEIDSYRDYSIGRELCSNVYSDGSGGGAEEEDADGNNSGPAPGTISPGTGDDDLSIRRFEISTESNHSWRHEVNVTLAPGQEFWVVGEAEVKNKGDAESEDVDWDYRIDHGRNFDTDDSKVDQEKKLDIDPGETKTKHMSRIKIAVSTDGSLLSVHDKNHQYVESFQFINGQAKFYIFVDVESKKTGDDDISSDHSKHNEYGVVRVNVEPLSGNVVKTMRFYNTQFVAHYYSIKASDIHTLPTKWPDWQYHGTSFRAFTTHEQGTVPIYVCWKSAKTHQYTPDYEEAARDCSHAPFIAHYNYPEDGPGRRPIYEMWHGPHSLYIYANGAAEAASLNSKWGYYKINGGVPKFWAPQ